jgi:hypothetical protein
VFRSIYKKYSLLLRAGAVVALVTGLKLLAHTFGWEVLSLNPLFSGTCAAATPSSRVSVMSSVSRESLDRPGTSSRELRRGCVGQSKRCGPQSP